MIKNELRIGNFTSSQIANLMKAGKGKENFSTPALTYIEECKFERKLGRSLETETDARPLSWGKLLESRAFEILGLEYSLISTDTIQHPLIPYWSGSPDGVSENAVVDIKCPLTLKSFCQLVEPIYAGLQGIQAMTWIRENHKDGEKFYWQLVSNSILTDKSLAELIIYMPYKNELEEIKLSAHGNPKFYWIWAATDEELPYLIESGYYKNLNKIEFFVPVADKRLLEETVIAAGKILIEEHKIPAPQFDIDKIKFERI